ncbi:vesicle-associated membrane protein 4-like [Halichondria panicea]|uniref:vesicle-associated membrane protein 4-like n=1 Tax=Halichondria panicea TaxID=6063 RepID=UPI00312B92C5
MPPKFKRGPDNGRDRIHLLGLDSSDEEEEELFINSSPDKAHTSSREAQDPKIRHVQSQVSGVISIMKENISKVMDRGEKLESLEEKSEGLSESSSHFRHSSRRLQRKAWWQQCRLKLIVAAVILAVVIGVIVIIVVKTQPSN